MGLRSAFLALAAVFTAASSSGQSLVTNGDFAADLSSWYSFGVLNGSTDWSSVDLSADPASGSALVANTWDELQPGSGTGIEQTLQLTGNSTYLFRAMILIPTGQTTARLTGGIIYLYGLTVDGHCENYLDWWFQLPSVTVEGAWSSTGVLVHAPPAAACARLGVGSWRYDVGPPLTVHYDAVELIPLLFADDFEFGTLQFWQSSQ
jgi:hypothetical protein